MKRSILIGGGIVLLVLLLGGAAFVAGRLLNGQGIPGPSSGVVRSAGLDTQSAKKLPPTAPDVGKGIFDHRQGNSIFVGTGQIQMSAKKDPQSGQVHVSSTHSGPVVEVVVTTQTTIYHVATMEQVNGPPARGQQVLEPGSLDEIGQSSSITVWGRKTGDRYIADVLVYTSPAFITK
jgi:hypothetical protein